MVVYLSMLQPAAGWDYLQVILECLTCCLEPKQATLLCAVQCFCVVHQSHCTHVIPDGTDAQIKPMQCTYLLPLIAGEYAMLKAAALNGWLKEEDAVLEALLGMRRAGAELILSYYATDAAKWMNK